MKATLKAAPHFTLVITEAEYTTLVSCSKSHYDGVCKSSSLVGGFLYGWGNCKPTDPEESFIVNATFRQLDTCLKILEMPPSRFEKESRELYYAISHCMRESKRYLNEISITLL